MIHNYILSKRLYLKYRNKFIFVIFFTLAFVFVGHYFIVGQATYGDGIFYYAYTRSLIVDGDLNFNNEFTHKYSPENNNSSYEVKTSLISRYDEVTGMLINRQPLGAPLFWLFPFFIVHFFYFLINGFSSFVMNGYSNVYQTILGFYNIFLVCLGLFFIQNVLRRLDYQSNVVLFTLFSVTFGSNLLYYASVDVLNSHPVSFFVGACILYCIFKFRFERFYSWFFLGAVVGVMALVRTQDLLFAVLPLLFLFVKPISSFINKWCFFAKLCLFYVLGIVLSFVPQMLYWKYNFGSYLGSHYLSQNSGGFDFFSPNVTGVMFNFKTGLLVWTPIHLLFVFGIILLFKRRRSLSYVVLIFYLLQIYFIASWHAWDQGESFGIRMIISTFPLLCIPLAESFTYLRNRFSDRVNYFVSGFLILFTCLSIVGFLLFVQTPFYDTNVGFFEKISRELNIFEVD